MPWLQPVACGPGVPCVIYRQPEPVVHQKYVEKQVPKLFRYERYVEPPPLPKRPIPWAPPPLPAPAPPPPARRPRMRAPNPEPCCCCCCNDKEETALVPSYKSKKKKSREAGIDLSALRNVQCVCDDELAVLTAAVAAAMAAEQSDEEDDDEGSSIEVICPAGSRPGESNPNPDADPDPGESHPDPNDKPHPHPCAGSTPGESEMRGGEVEV